MPSINFNVVSTVLAKFHRDNPVSAGSLKGFGYHFSKRRIVRQCSHCAQTSEALQGFGERFKRRDGLDDRQFQPLDQFNRIGSCGETLQAVLHSTRPAPWLWGASPATSLVCFETSRSTCAPIFSNGIQVRFRWRCKTPSRDTIGVPIGRSMIPFVPFDPACAHGLASLATPLPSASRAASSCSMNFRHLDVLTF